MMTENLRNIPWRVAAALLCLALTAAGCLPQATPPTPVESVLPSASPIAVDSPTPFQPSPLQPTATEPVVATATSTPTTTLSPSPAPQPALYLPGYLPAPLQSAWVLPANFTLAADPSQAQLVLQPGDSAPLSRWVYALVAPFPTLEKNISASALKKSWKKGPQNEFTSQPLLMDESTYQVFAHWWGEAAAGAVDVLPAGELLGEAYQRQPAWAVIPFEEIQPRWKVLEIDGISPLHKAFDAQSYALTVPFSLQGDPQALADLAAQGFSAPSTNRDPQRLTTLAMTGVTALVRATAFTMYRNGILYPGEDVRPILREADLAHISNEIPFSPDCPPPNPIQADLRFCSDPDYIALLEDIGADVIELTGDHFGDWGAEAMRTTLDMYVERGWTYYGGGYDRQDARQARLFEHNGNKIAFIGCNAKGGGYATAAEANPGAVSCDWEWMHAEIGRLSSQGYLVIATFQHFEYYTYAAQPNQIEDSRGMAEAGAVIVSGSQAHQPQGLEFYKQAFIHYGLGNLFFDQFNQINVCPDLACNYGFIDRHVFYEGRYLGVELIPIVFIDFARPRLMDTAESAELLQKVFSASGW